MSTQKPIRSVSSLPVVDVAEDRIAAALVELGDAELLDLLLRGDPELLLDLELDREPVAVPAGLARDVVAAASPGSAGRCP